MDRFWEHVEAEGECLVWTGATVDGYGKLNRGGKYHLAHRYHWEAERGPVPDGLELDHLCRNRRCVNLDHLEPVTGKVNTLRGEGPTAVNARREECVNGHAFTPENTYVAPGSGQRKCRACMAAIRARRKARLSGNEKRPKPTRETLEAELAEYTAVALGEWYGVSDTTIRNWARKYGIAP